MRKLVLIAALAFRATVGFGLGPNLMMNSSFEHGDIVSWFSSSNACQATNQWAHNAQWSAKGTGWAALEQNVRVIPGANYVTSVWAAGSGRAYIRVQDSSKTHTLAYAGPVSLFHGFRQIAASWNSATYNDVVVELWIDYGSGTAYWDDVFTGLADSVTDVQFNPLAIPGDWRLVFRDNFSNPATIDSGATGRPGYNWYPQMFFGYGTNPPSAYSVSGNVLTIDDAADPWGDTLHTAHPDQTLGWRGTTFSVGKGLYVEARIKMMNVSQIGSNGWPSFWFDDIRREAWTGIESAEADIMEYAPQYFHGGDTTLYDFTLHDWIPNQDQIGSSNSQIYTPAGTDFTQWHTYGMLMMPGGYVQAFFDGIPQVAHVWQPGWHFSVTESAQFMLILGACRGGVPTMAVNYVHMYALDPASSVHTQ
jgi:hypothetical protein